MARDAAVFVKEVPMCVTRNVGAWSEKEGRREKAGGASDRGERVMPDTGASGGEG